MTVSVFPLGLFKASFYSLDMGSTTSRIIFTIQQHTLSMIPLMLGGLLIPPLFVINVT